MSPGRIIGSRLAQARRPDGRAPRDFSFAAFLLEPDFYLLLNYLRALAWAIVFAVALWPLYIRTYRRAHSRLTRETVPLLFTAVVGSIFLVPFAFLVVEAVREIQDIVDYSRQIEQSGVPVRNSSNGFPMALRR